MFAVSSRLSPPWAALDGSYRVGHFVFGYSRPTARARISLHVPGIKYKTLFRVLAEGKYSSLVFKGLAGVALNHLFKLNFPLLQLRMLCNLR